jgi:signal transduction histidine kinase
LAFLLVISFISVQLRNIDNSLLLYLPTAFGIIAIHWFGPRVLLPIYINGLFTLFLWKAHGGIGRYLLLASHEPLVAFVSWILSRHLTSQGKAFDNVNNFIPFVFLGIVIPGATNCFYTYHYTFVNGDLEQVALLWLSDFITMYCIAVPVMHFFQPGASRWLLSVRLKKESFDFLRNGLTEFFLLMGFSAVLNLVVDFKQYWFVYGIGSCMIAVRRGFNLTVATNFILFSFSYLIPLAGQLLHLRFIQPSSQLVYVHVGMATMFFVSAIIGRAISDSRLKEEELMDQKKQLEAANDQLKKTNSDLDRFVYSVSHDISAPLKSIRGLIGLFRMEGEAASVPFYIDKIQQSVVKLENFTQEVLDHSRSSRKEILPEPVALSPFFQEIMENLKYLPNFDKIKITFDLKESTVVTDRFLLKVASSNILSNAIKYQRTYGDQHPEVKISSCLRDGVFEISFEDNGEGIKDDIKEKVFDMFYRASMRSSGSGLGLYIARESIHRLNGHLSLITRYGEGSTFKISLPQQADQAAPASK